MQASVTVLVSFNRAAFVERTVRSLLEQTHPLVEVVVLDVGGDDTAARVERAFGARVTVLGAPGGSIPRARNAALARCEASYVALASADTPAAPTRIARQVEALEAHPGAGLCHTGVWFVAEDGAPTPLPPERRPRRGAPRAGARGAMARTLLLEGNPILGATVLLRRSVLDATGLFDETPGLGWDFDLWVRVAQVADVVFVDEPLVAYRARTFAIPDDGPSAATLRHLTALDKHARRTAPSLGIPADALARRRGQVLLELAYEAVVEGQPALARRALREAVRLGPLPPGALGLFAAAHVPARAVPWLRTVRRALRRRLT